MGALINKKLCFLIMAVPGLLLPVSGCSKKQPQEAASQQKQTEDVNKTQPHGVSDKPLADFQVQLLNLAIETADSIPTDPFIKDRSTAQALVADSCLKLDQPVRAVHFADKIDNWRRGLCYANTAFYLAEHGCDAEQLQKGLDLAEKIAALDHGQKWRSDRIKAKIAQTYVLLGNSQKVEQFSKGLVDSESAKVKETEASTVSPVSFDDQIKSLDASIALQNFDIMKSVLYAYAQLFNRFYEDTTRRDLVEDKIKTSWDKIPGIIRFDLLIRLADYALEHSDPEGAQKQLDEAQSLLEDYQWPPEKRISLTAELVKSQFKAGDASKAQTAADEMWAIYPAERENIICVYRVNALIPLAEAYQVIGNQQGALSVYQQIIDECTENTNPKTCAEDLSAACSSMAVYAVKPSPALWTQIRQLQDRLNNS